MVEEDEEDGDRIAGNPGSCLSVGACFDPFVSCIFASMFSLEKESESGIPLLPLESSQVE